MDTLAYNTNHGYAEAVVRGYRNNLMTSNDYSMLCECTTLTDVRTLLQDRYGGYLQSIPPGTPLSAALITSKMREKLVDDFRHVQSSSTGSLSRFLDLVCHQYMIDNAVQLLLATAPRSGAFRPQNSRDRHDGPSSVPDLEPTDQTRLAQQVAKLNPLGLFDSIATLSVPRDQEDFFRIAFVETPLGDYLKWTGPLKKLFESSGDFSQRISVLRAILYKNYLDRFYLLITTDSRYADSNTSSQMVEFIELEADRQAITLTLDLLGADLNRRTEEGRAELIDQLYPACGKLYPVGTYKLVSATTAMDVFEGMKQDPTYASIGRSLGLDPSSQQPGAGAAAPTGAAVVEPGTQTMSLFAQVEMEKAKMTFTHQFSHASAYAWLRLHELEIRNVTWICECIHQNFPDRIRDFVSVL